MKNNYLIMTFAVLMNTISLMAQERGIVTDLRDGKTYKTVKIGTQTWTAENLDAITFINGDPIPEAKTKGEWQSFTDNKKAAWCYYDNDPGNGKKYGKLYNWFAVIDPRGLAPKGWHIPANEEWSVLTTFLGGENVAGTKMKSTTGWYMNSLATDESGFSGLPGGYRNDNGTFILMNISGFWWSSTEDTEETLNAWFRYLYYGSASVYRYSGRLSYKQLGLTVRCLRD
jgi:uncharacterized protein (TIGR02145 family)